MNDTMNDPVKQIPRRLLVIAALASLLVPFHDANAWVAAGRGFGGHGFVAAGGGYHGGYYGGYHGGGCYGCGAAAGAVAGLAVGAAIVSASRPAAVFVEQPPVIVDQPVAVIQQPVYYTAGNQPIGSQFAVLPPGSRSMVVNGVNFYQNGANWYKPFFGSNGVYYEVVQAP